MGGTFIGPLESVPRPQHHPTPQMRAMARQARIIAPGFPHHVMQRSSEGEPVFIGKQSREYYLQRLAEFAAEHRLEVLAYSLLADRVHLVVLPRDEESLAMALRRAHSSYGRYLNSVQGTSGSVWQNRFYSFPMDQDWLYAAVKYVERAPVLARLARQADAYAWSSAPAHCGRAASAVLSASWPKTAEKKKWAAWLRQPQPDEEIQAIERATSRGFALGGEAFLAKLSRKAGRPVGPRQVGRPPKGG